MKKKEVILIAYSSGTKKKKGNKSKKAQERVPKTSRGVSKNKGKKKVENKGKGKCLYCQGEGHWKRNCPKFLESIKRKDIIGEGETFSNLSIFKYSKSSYNAWVLDIGASSHIYSSLQDLASERRLGSNEVTLKLGDRASIAAKAMGTTFIDLNDHVLLLNNILYVPNVYKNIISISSMTRKCYKLLFERDVYTFYFNNKIVGMGYVLHGLYYIDNKSNNK